MLNNQSYWFAARTRANQEINMRESLKKLEVIHFLPTHFVTRIYTDRRKRVEVPLVGNLIFVKCTKLEAFSLLKNYSLKLSYIRDITTGSLLMVPDIQMERFMFAVNTAPELLKACNTPFAAGDRVRVVKGDFTGFEGELVRLEGKSHVILRIPQILTISIKIPMDHLQKIPSSNNDTPNYRKPFTK